MIPEFKRFFSFFLYLCLTISIGAAQASDSLFVVKMDSIGGLNEEDDRRIALNLLIDEELKENGEWIKTYWKEIYELCSTLNSKKMLGRLHHVYGFYINGKGWYDSTMVHYKTALKFYTLEKDSVNLGRINMNIGNTFHYKGNPQKSIEYYQASYRIREKIGDVKGKGDVSINLGIVYAEQEKYDRAMEYFKIALSIEKEGNDTIAMANTMNNIAMTYLHSDSIEVAEKILNEALALWRKKGSRGGEVMTLHNLGALYMKKEDYKNALAHFNTSLKMSEMMNFSFGIMQNKQQLGHAKFKVGNYSEAIDLYIETLPFLESQGVMDELKESYDNMSKAYKELRDFESAYKYLYKVKEVEDTLGNVEIKKRIAEVETEFETERVENDNKLMAKEREIDKTKLSFQKTINWMVGGILFIALVFLVNLFIQFRAKKKHNKFLTSANDLILNQNREIEKKRDEILEQKTALTDSIEYAKRLQHAILPPPRLIKEWLRNSFVLYRPKDIVSGDFYWMESVQGRTWFAAVDCTGHGVPGAMVSVMGHNALNRAVNEFGITETGPLLNKVSELLEANFEMGDEEINDGMDLSLVCIDWEKQTAQFSGANNPLYILNKKSLMNERFDVSSGIKFLDQENVENPDDAIRLVEMKGDSRPIGRYDSKAQFATHVFDLKKGDEIIVFSDGFADQFGGNKGKKFKYKPFKQLCVQNYPLQMEEKFNELNRVFDDWIGDFEQVDDLCIICVKI